MGNSRTDQEIIDTALLFKTRGEWWRAHHTDYLVAYRRGLLPQIYAKLEPEPRGPQPLYTDQQIIDHAKQFKTQKAWDDADAAAKTLGIPSYYSRARIRGIQFVRLCCAHMERAPHPIRFKHTDAQIEEAAKKYFTRRDFKHGPDRRLYAAGLRRHKHNPDFWKRITAHMQAPINPFYGNTSVIYAIEFESRHAYVGLSVDFGKRLANHIRKGPVMRHIKRHPDDKWEHRFLQTGLTVQEASNLEGYWQKHQADEGWIPLWSAKAGGTGSIPKTHTLLAILDKAKSYTSRSRFQLENQGMVRYAKLKGWYEEIMLLLPCDWSSGTERLRQLSEQPVSDATKAKQSASAKARFAKGVVPPGAGKLVVVVAGIGPANALLAEQTSVLRSLELVDKGNWIADVKRLGELPGAVMATANADKLVKRLQGAGYKVELIRGHLSHQNIRVAKNAGWATDRAQRLLASTVLAVQT
jgi:hypothetical protein